MKNLNILDFGTCVQDGRWTPAFRAAVAELSACGGGTLTVPAGTYVTGPIEYCSDMTMELCEGAVLSFTNDGEAHPRVTSRYEGIDREVFMPLIFGSHVKNVVLCGKGTIEGNGAAWWEKRKEWTVPRPRTVVFQDSENIVIRDITIQNSPCWTVVPLRSKNILVDGIAIHNPFHSPNTDGVDPDSCQNVEIRNCLLDVGDDCIAIKSGTEENQSRIPSEHIYVHDCVMRKGHCGVGIGSEMSGGVRDVRIEDCTFIDTERGLRLKTRRGRGGYVDGISFKRVSMKNVLVPFVINMRYFCGNEGINRKVADTKEYPVDEGTPRVSNVSLVDFRAEDVNVAALWLSGLAEAPIENVTLRNVTISMAENAHPGIPDAAIEAPCMWKAGLVLKFAKNLRMDNVQVTGVEGLTNLFSDCEDIYLDGEVYEAHTIG